MNAPMATRAQQRAVELTEIESWVAGIRHEIDALWHAARDATTPGGKGAFPPESNRKVADDAAFQALQCLHQLENHVVNLRRLP